MKLIAKHKTSRVLASCDLSYKRIQPDLLVDSL